MTCRECCLLVKRLGNLVVGSLKNFCMKTARLLRGTTTVRTVTCIETGQRTSVRKRKAGSKISYHGYVPLLKGALLRLEHPPAILEVGVDRGVTFVTLLAWLARNKQEFLLYGVDIMVQEQVRLMVANLDLTPKQQAFLHEGNSLEAMPKLIDQKFRFDVLLLDGDHNYHTVSKELEHLNDLVYPHSLVIIDDYEGRWAEKDLWYAERPGYEAVACATTRVESEKHGVKAAVDDYLSTHQEWKSARPIPGEPIVLVRRDT